MNYIILIYSFERLFGKCKDIVNNTNCQHLKYLKNLAHI